MDIKEIKEKLIWEGFLQEIEEKTFLHSFVWGKFQEDAEEKIWRFGIYEKEELMAVALAVKVSARRGSYLLVPHGPLFQNSKFEVRNSKQIINSKLKILNALAKKLKEIGKKERVGFLRVNSTWERNDENIKIFQQAGFRDAPLHIHPEATWQLDIRLKEEDLLKNMRKTTRYLIKKSLKDEDIEIVQSRDIRDIEIFSKLHNKVSLRQKFVPFSKNYLKKEFSTFLKDDQIILFLGKYKGKVVASAFTIFYSQKGFYHHAALLTEYSKIPIAYRILWETIKEAKRRGCDVFDFWGYVSPKENPKHPWAGPTLFKMGFGGEKKEYVKAQDAPLSFAYYKTWLIETLRKQKRNL